MLIALVSVVLVWWQLQGFFTSDVNSDTATTTASSTVPVDAARASTSTAAASTTPVTNDLRASELPLTPAQRKLAESLGLDPAQIVISDALIACVREKLGASRYEQILAGATPSLLESAKLLACL